MKRQVTVVIWVLVAVWVQEVWVLAEAAKEDK